MCGIAGYINCKKQENNKINKVLNKMLEASNHRGPDERYTITGENYGFGTNRLSIQSIKYGKQPIEDKSFIAGFNGEIFNFFDLNKEFNLNSSSEIDLILKLFKKFKFKFIQKIKGQFAIYIYDKVNQKLYLFRDRFGIRPIYYSINGLKTFIFSSEIKSILPVSELDHSISNYSLACASMFWTNFGDNTSFENIKIIPPNHYLCLDEKFKVQLISYENYFFNTKKFSGKFNLYETLRNSVKNQIFGEVGFCSYLSGGIDSSIIALLLKQITKKKIDTFSISFEDNEYDESSAQKKVSSFLNTNHSTLHIKNNDISDNFLETVFAAETYLFRTAPVPMFLLSKYVKKKGHKVFFSGEGADEILFGYDIFFETKIRKFWSRDVNSKYRFLLFKRLYKYLPQFKNSRYFNLIKDFYRTSLKIEDDLFYSHFVRWSQYNFMSSYFHLNDDKKCDSDSLLEKFLNTLPKDFSNLSLMRRAQYIECSTLLTNYLLSSQGDRVSMANSMEGRYPYLDEHLLKNTLGMSTENLAPTLKSKNILRETFKNFLPKDILNRNKIAYQAPEARSFFSKNNSSQILDEYVSSLNSSDDKSKNNALDLIKKIKDPLSSKRLGFRENMAFILGLSGFCLKKFKKKYKRTQL